MWMTVWQQQAAPRQAEEAINGPLRDDGLRGCVEGAQHERHPGPRKRDDHHRLKGLHGRYSRALRHDKRQRRVYARRRTRDLRRPAGRQAFGRRRKTEVPVHRRRANVPRAGFAVRHLLRGQSVGEGNVQALESLHRGGQIRTPVIGRVREFPDHLQARWL